MSTSRSWAESQIPGHRVTGNRSVRARRTRLGNDGRYLGTAGWEFVHVCVDDATRLAYAEVLSDERGPTAAALPQTRLPLVRGARDHRHSSHERQRLLLPLSRSTPKPAVELGLRHLRTQPYRPRTNGKAERFIQTLQNRWAYGALYGNSAERTRALPGWLTHYNYTRRHGSLGHKPPAARLAELEQPTSGTTPRRSTRGAPRPRRAPCARRRRARRRAARAPSMPSARPAPPGPRDLAPAQRVALAPGIERLLGRLGEPPRERAQHALEHDLDVRGRRAERCGGQRAGEPAARRAAARAAGPRGAPPR